MAFRNLLDENRSPLEHEVGEHEVAEDEVGLERVVAADAPRPAPVDRPWVMVNFVASVTGSVTNEGRVAPLSDAADSAVFHGLRGLADVVLAGAGTVRAERYGPIVLDEPTRSVRHQRGQRAHPTLCVLTRSYRFDWSIPAFAVGVDSPTIVAGPTTTASIPSHLGHIAAGPDADTLDRTLGSLRRQDFSVLLCEGGPELLSDLLDARAVDEVFVTIAPLVGGDPLAMTARGGSLDQATLLAVHEANGHLFLRYLVGDAARV